MSNPEIQRSHPKHGTAKGVVGRGRRPPLLSTGGRVPHSHPTFWTEIRAKVSPLLQLVYWLLTETQCKIISVQQN